MDLTKDREIHPNVSFVIFLPSRLSRAHRGEGIEGCVKVMNIFCAFRASVATSKSIQRKIRTLKLLSP